MRPQLRNSGPANESEPFAIWRSATALTQRLRRVCAGGAILASGISVTGCTSETSAEPREVADVPRLEGELIHYSARFAARANLKLVEVKQAGLVPAVAVVGTVTFDPEHVARVGTRLRGLVRAVRRFEGDSVRKGDVLATIDSPELGEAQAAIASLNAELDAARRNAKRERLLADEKLTTQRESEEASALVEKYEALLGAAKQKVAALSGSPEAVQGQSIGLHRIIAPMDGTVVERHIAQGQLVEGDLTAYLVANLDTLWVELAVFERSLGLIHVGDEVLLRPLGSHENGILGKVANVGQVLSASTRSAPVRVIVDNRRRLLRPGQAVDATIRAGGAAKESGPVVPPESVTFVDGKPTVFVAVGANAVRVATVVLGTSDGKELHIKSGVAVGDRVVSDGTFELKSELFR